MPINWELARMPNVAGNMLKAYDEGRYQRALGDLTTNPDDTKALSIVMQQNPEVGLRLRKAQQDEAFGKAASEYYGGGNALLGFGRHPIQSGASMEPGTSQPMNALMVPQGFSPALPGDQAQEGTPMLGEGSSVTSAPKVGVPEPQTGSEFAMLGQPRTQADAAFLKMVKLDAPRALKIRSEMRNNFVKMLGQTHDVYAHAIDRLSQTNDEVGYQQVLQELTPMVTAIGGDLAGAVPPHYPGPDGVRQLMMKALDVKDRLSHLLAQDRTDAYVNNLEADNARADRNTDSLIYDRNARRGETRRYNDARISTTRRGQDMRGGGGGLVRVKSIEEARALKPGTKFIDPNGNVRVR